MREWLGGDKDVRLVLRFLGTTPSSSDFETLLRHLCAQIYSYEADDLLVANNCKF
mgnify:CR=1 FL=1